MSSSTQIRGTFGRIGCSMTAQLSRSFRKRVASFCLDVWVLSLIGLPWIQY